MVMRTLQVQFPVPLQARAQQWCVLCGWQGKDHLLIKLLEQEFDFPDFYL